MYTIWPKNEWNALGCLGESDKALAGCGTRNLKNEMSRERGRVRLYQQREKHVHRLGGTRRNECSGETASMSSRLSKWAVGGWWLDGRQLC